MKFHWRLTVVIALLLAITLGTPIGSWGQASQWVTFQCTNRGNFVCNIVFHAKQAEVDDLKGSCPEHDGESFLNAYTAILVVARPQSRTLPYRLGRDVIPLHFDNDRIALTVGDRPAVRPSWGDPTLATRYPCYTTKLRDRHETRVGLVASPDNPAIILVPFPKASGKVRLLVPFFTITGTPPYLVTLRQYVNATFELELK